MERLPIWLSAVGGADSRARHCRYEQVSAAWYAPIASAAALIERPVQGHSTEGEHWCTTAGEHGGENGMLLLPL